MQARAIATVGLILLVAFSLGYKGDTLVERIRNRSFRSATAPVSEPAPPGSEVAPDIGAADQAPGAGAPPPPPDSALPGDVSGFTVLPGRGTSRPGAGPAPAVAPGPPSPQLNPQGNLTNTLDSVRAPEVTDELRTQRNTYFDALQKQLSQMKEDQAPVSGNNGAPAPGQQGFVLPQPPSGPPGSGPNGLNEETVEPEENDQAEQADEPADEEPLDENG